MNGIDRGNKYARDIVGGKIVACKWVILACQRHLDDLRASQKETYRWVFDKAAAEKAIKFIENMYHTKGKWAQQRQRITLEPWQCFFIMCVFGWKNRTTGYRRFKKALLFVPRKNGKSIKAAGIGNYMFAADGEYGAEVYSGATTEKQAWEVFRPAKIMTERNSDYRDWYGIQVNASNLHIPDDGSRFEPVIGKPGDGTSPHCGIVDEYHEHKTDEMVETFQTGMGAREQPLLLIITTAGSNIAGPCYELQKEAERMLDSVSEDDELFAMIYTIDADDDWTSPATLEKANPNIDVSVRREFLEAQQADAIRNARKQSIFKTKHLNVWVGARNAFFNVQRWHECADENLKLEDFEGERCYIGLDLASRVDIAALELIFPVGENDFVRFGKYYLPEERVLDGSNERYDQWLKEGWLTITEGDMIDFQKIKADIDDILKKFEVVELAFDPWQATMLITELMGEGAPCIEVRATVQNFSEPMKHMDGLIRSRRIRHNGDPVFTWMVSNTVAKVDAKDNVYPRKEREEDKIDGVVAHLMAMNRIMADQDRDLSDVLSNMISVKM